MENSIVTRKLKIGYDGNIIVTSFDIEIRQGNLGVRLTRFYRKVCE